MRTANAHDILEKIRCLPPQAPRFEPLWYDFLVNFNNAFSQLEQGAKISHRSKEWFSKVKKFRKTDALLIYLQHARNFEEHSDLGSIIRTKLGSRLIKLDPQPDRCQFDHRQEIA
jgi:hypothetical protein